MSIKSRLRNAIPEPIKHQLARLKRKGQQEFFQGRFFERDLMIFDADQLSKGWYGKEWSTKNRSEFSALSEIGLPSDALIFDIGAHQGVVSMLLKEIIAPKGQVIALEMDRKNVRAAKLNIWKNEIPDISIRHQAISDRKGFTRHTGRSNSNIAPKSALNALLPKVQTTSIDEMCRIYGTPHLIYLDVEGAEILALKGAKKVLSFRPVWFIELHGDDACAQFGGRNADVITTLHDYAYHIRFASSEASEFREIDETHDYSSRGFLLATPHPKS